MLIIERLIKSIRDAAAFNPEVQAAPACILWPDHGRQWEAVLLHLQEELLELVILGNNSPEKSTVPVFWRHQDFMTLQKKSRLQLG
ncbi:MAG: hypothetical protein WCW68_10950 [Methanothrix sp.]